MDMSLSPPYPLAAAEPAAGSPAEDLVPAAIVAALMVAGGVWFSLAHRNGKTMVLTRLGALSERVSGLPGWTALPAAMTTASLLVAVFGFYWDVATHIDNGRDPGPFANPAHYLIIAGLAGIALAGAVSLLLGRDKSPTSVRIGDGWEAPVGGVLLFVCGGIAVLGFPLDDVWHRLFGQDVTLWSPTHIQMVGGAALSTLALWILVIEGGRAARDKDRVRRTLRIGEPFLAGSFLIGLSALQAEFDFSVPQFRLLYHPILLMGSAGIALVAARIRLGRGGALKAALVFLAIRGIVSAAVGPVLGHTTLHFPLYLIEALAVEAVALRVGTDRQLSIGALSGAAIGTAGLAAEWAWSHVWMTIPWPAALLPEGVLFGVVAAVAGGVTGGFIGRAFIDPGRPRQLVPKTVGVVAAAGLLVVLVYPFPTSGELDGSATISLQRVEDRGDRFARATVAVNPANAATDAEWFNVTSWQGGGSVVQELRKIGPGRYTAPQPVPVYGEWKSLLRLHTEAYVVAVPIYLPADPAIPAVEVPAKDNVSRPFVLDKKIVLREAREVSSALTYTASIVLALVAAVWMASLTWGLRRLELDGGERRHVAPPVPATS